MKKLLFKSVLSAMAVGLLCAGYVSADVVNDSISTDNVGVSAAVTFDMPRVHPDSAIKALPRKTLLEWPMKTQEGARNWKGIVEAAQQLPYEVKAPSYIPYGYQLYTARQDRNDVLEVVYYKKGVTIYRDGKKYIDSSLDTVRDIPYVPSEYGDIEWSKSGDSSEVYFTGDPETHMVRSISWTKDGMAYSLFFLERVKEADAEFYKEHVVPLKSIDSSRYELVGNYPTTPKTIEEIKEEHVVPMKA
ncbi:MAG: hypothetical protein E7I16_09525 [Veillonella sp.]|nr:hypothetical protein [Veillonella sp.]